MIHRECKVCEQTFQTIELRQGRCNSCGRHNCVYCDEPLSKWEQRLAHRACWRCRRYEGLPVGLPQAA